MVELIITEKPQAAKKIADALCDGKPVKENISGVPYYKIAHGNNDILVGCAVGHLFGLDQKEGKKWNYPNFDIEWKPSHENKKQSAFTKKYLNALKKLSKQAKEYTVATDYDIEGEVIGHNVIKYVCKQKDANRMKFSTLTKDDLVNAYENKSKTLDWGQANAGETRHFLDWYNGINLSRALTASIKATGSFKIMSTGRVQGPALKIIVEKEKEISAFKAEPFWQIELSGKVQKNDILGMHIADKFWKEEEASKVMENVKGQKEGKIKNIKKSTFQQAPPIPFDLTTLQTETYRCHKIPPKTTLEIAQELYSSGYISYPRTSSQQYPESIEYKKVLSLLTKNPDYKKLSEKILASKTIKPNNGKKTDPAHPAIYPTGIIPSLDSSKEKVYDIIVKRFLSTFATPATREVNKFETDVNSELFLTKGTRTIVKGWHEFYSPYVKLEEEEIPKVSDNDIVKINKIDLQEKETSPPKRYTPASIIRAMEKRNLGTKATRSQIIDTLFSRGYVDGKSIQATELGIRTIETLEKYSPEIVDEKLTKHFEEEMEKIRQGKKKGEEVLKEAREGLTKILENFKSKEKEIGNELLTAHRETRDKMVSLGACMKCKDGILQIRKGKFGQFVACNKYPDCKNTFSLPKNALIKPSDKMCELCNHPLVKSIRKGKQPLDFCLNPDCKSKHLEGQAGKDAKAYAKGEIEKECPKCKKGNVVLRKSIYGSFLGCNNYPKCKYTEQIAENDKST